MVAFRNVWVRTNEVFVVIMEMKQNFISLYQLKVCSVFLLQSVRFIMELVL